MNAEEKKFNLYLTVLRFLTFKITSNIKRIFLDFDMNSRMIRLTAFYETPPSEVEKELFDDIITDSKAHIPDFTIESVIRLLNELNLNDKHDFVIFATYDGE